MTIRPTLLAFAILGLAILGLAASFAWAQEAAQPQNPPAGSDDLRWRSPNGNNRGFTPNTSAPGANAAGGAASNGAIPGASGPLPVEPLRPIVPGARPRIARVTSGSGSLPNAHGQVWREYDITPYTLKVTSTKRPETAIIDWVLRETGYETWHGEQVAVLASDARTLRVYHTPEVHDQVGDIVDRFVNPQADNQAFGVRMLAVEKPSWRVRAQPFLQAVPVETQGVQAWLLSREDATVLLTELVRRTDVREHGSPHLLVQNGQVVSVPLTRMRNYVQGITMRDSWPGFDNLPAQYNEGLSLDFSPLLSVDGRTIDAVVKCQIDQIEKLHPVMIESTNPAAPRQRTKIDVPQVSQYRLQERFRWPADRVLLIGLGMAPTPIGVENRSALAPLIPPQPPRADLLIFLENRGALANLGQPGTAPAGTFPPAVPPWAPGQAAPPAAARFNQPPAMPGYLGPGYPGRY